MTPFSLFSYTKDHLSLLPPRPERSNKRTFGRVLCICGSEGMAGAAFLAGKAAYRTGAGLVEIFTPAVNRPILQTLLPEAIVTSYEPDGWEAPLSEALERADAIVIGCGLGQSEQARRILAFTLRHASLPTVIDADGLNLLAKHPCLIKHAQGAVLTPHPLEMSRLCGRSVENILADPPACAYEFAKTHGVICVLKDHETAVSDGSPSVYLNKSGNSGMATGGSGDVLAGMIGGLLGQSHLAPLSRFKIATLAVYLHGLAGDLVAKQTSPYSLMAGDLPDAIGQVLSRGDAKDAGDAF